MISLKAVVIAASTVGTVAVGGVTWAAVGQPGDTAPRSATGDLPAVVDKATKDAPRAAVPSPTCLPAPDVAGKANPGTSYQPGPGERGAKLPVCPEPKTLPRPDARVPSDPTKKVRLPRIPDVPRLACDKLAPAVQVGGTLERTLMISKGLTYASGKTGVTRLNGKPTCSSTQRWVATPGGAVGDTAWLTVERIKHPAGMTVPQVRQALKVPANAVRSTSVNGTAVLQAPGGRSAVVMIDPAGYAVLVNGSPVLATSPWDVATRLAKAAG